MEEESKRDGEAAFKKRSAEMEKKNEVNLDDGDDFLKGLKTFGADD
jgi:hypothetical protein